MSNFNHYWSDISSDSQKRKFNPIWKMVPHDVSSIADIGGGIGAFYDVIDTDKLESFHYQVIDSSETAIKKVHERGLRGVLHNIDKSPLPIQDNSYDLVLLSDVLEHMNNPWAVLYEAARISNKYIIVHGPNFAYWKCRMDALRGHPIRQMVVNRNGSLVDKKGRKANHIYYITYKNLIFWAGLAGLKPKNISVFGRKIHKPFKFILEHFFRNYGEQYTILFEKKDVRVTDHPDFHFY